MMALRTLLRAIARDPRGVTAIEFGIAMPVMAVILMALFDLGFQVYAQSAIQGSVQQAARAVTLESGATNAAALDTMVEDSIQAVVPNAVVTFTRRNYANFEDVGRPEDFTDTPGAEDGLCNNNEPFEDVNGNGIWDADRGISGVGGARDAVLYGASATFDRVFPFYAWVGLPKEVTIESSTVLRNQPFNEQGERTPVIGECL